MPDDQLIGERIAYHRKRLGLSQVEFAGLVGRSESWVSQVERGVRPVDRMSVLQRVADVLSVSVAELRGDDEAPDLDERPEAFDTIRLALTGHPAIGSVLGTVKLTAPARQMDVLRRQHADVWELVHGSRYAELAPILAALIPGLETATRTADSEEVRDEARELLGDTYQATAAMMVKIGETDAAWIAADRAGFCAETAGSPLAVAASMFRMAHVFLALGQIDQAHHVAASTAAARWNRRSPAGQSPKSCPCTGPCTWSSPSPPRGTTNAAKHASTWTPPARSPTSSARTATTTEPNSAPPTSPSTPSASPSNSATPGRPSSSATRSTPPACHQNDRPGTYSTWPRPTPCDARSAKPCTPSKKPNASPPRKPASTTSAEPSPASCSSSPAYGHDQNYATSPNDSAYCPSRPSRACLAAPRPHGPNCYSFQGFKSTPLACQAVPALLWHGSFGARHPTGPTVPCLSSVHRQLPSRRLTALRGYRIC